VAIPRQISLFLVATQFLTRLPVPTLREYQPQWLTRSARYFPLVGSLVGAINVGVWLLCNRWFPPAVSVGLMIAASLMVTGAFHEDGFADACDGFGGGTTRERILAIMRDSRVGAYGAIGIAMMLGLKWATLLMLPGAAIPLVVVGAHTMSRWCSTGLIWGLHYVRLDGEGKSKPLANSLSGRDWVLSGAIGAAALAAMIFVSEVPINSLACKALLPAMVAAGATACLSGAYFKQRIGGYTGDCLGATQQLSELAFMLTALAFLTPQRVLN
jgi:adenosylcobinamide-GDP ribazoletransferase